METPANIAPEVQQRFGAAVFVFWLFMRVYMRRTLLHKLGESTFGFVSLCSNAAGLRANSKESVGASAGCASGASRDIGLTEYFVKRQDLPGYKLKFPKGTRKKRVY